MNAVLARLVRGRAYHAPLGRVAVAADHDRPPPQLGMPQHLDRRDELVEVYVQYPPPHAKHDAPPPEIRGLRLKLSADEPIRYDGYIARHPATRPQRAK